MCTVERGRGGGGTGRDLNVRGERKEEGGKRNFFRVEKLFEVFFSDISIILRFIKKTSAFAASDLLSTIFNSSTYEPPRFPTHIALVSQ